MHACSQILSLFITGTRYISDTFSSEKAPLLRNEKNKESTAMLNEMCIPITEALPSSVSPQYFKCHITSAASTMHDIVTNSSLTESFFLW